MKVSEQLKQARVMLEHEGDWYRGRPSTGSRCIAIAIWNAGEEDPCTTPCIKVLLRATGLDALWALYDFNDTCTHPELLDALDRAIAIAEAEEAEHVYGDPLPDLEPAEMDLATVRTAIAAHDAREAGDSRLLTAIREATDVRVDEDRELAA